MSQNQLVQLLGGIGGVGGVANLTSLLSGARGSQSVFSETASSPSYPFSPQVSRQLGSVGSTSEAAAASAKSAPAPSTTASSTAGPVTELPAATASTASTSGNNSSGSASTSGPAIQLSDLQSILSGIKVPPGSEAVGAEANKEQPVNVDLSAAINMEVLQPLLDNKDLMGRVEKLLPPSTDSDKQPDALSMFSTALHSGQLGPLMQQFGMDESVVAAANSGDMAQFVKALQASKAAKEAKSPKKEENMDEDMGLD
ncbi:hypothetical protein MRX96_033295 [Rhipicephalus microplus]